MPSCRAVHRAGSSLGSDLARLCCQRKSLITVTRTNPIAAGSLQGEDGRGPALPLLPWTPELSGADTMSSGALVHAEMQTCRHAEMQEWLMLQPMSVKCLFCPKSWDLPPVAEGRPGWHHLSLHGPAHRWAEITPGNLESRAALGALMVPVRWVPVHCWGSAGAGACLVSEKFSYLAMQVDITNKACFSWQQRAINWCNYLE